MNSNGWMAKGQQQNEENGGGRGRGKKLNLTIFWYSDYTQSHTRYPASSLETSPGCVGLFALVFWVFFSGSSLPIMLVGCEKSRFELCDGIKRSWRKKKSLEKPNLVRRMEDRLAEGEPEKWKKGRKSSTIFSSSFLRFHSLFSVCVFHTFSLPATRST